MEEEVKIANEQAKENMDKAISHLKQELKKIRTGKADPNILNDIYVDYYGTSTPIYQLANINTPDPRTISIQPWDKNVIDGIEKAIQSANLGLNPSNDGELIRINIPALTEERRKELVKHVKALGENAKVSVRNVRREANDQFKKMKNEGLSEDEEKKAVDKMQEITNKYVKDIDKILEEKEKEIMEV